MNGKDGGSIFPDRKISPIGGGVDEIENASNGLTIRDYFAAKAMQGLISMRGDPNELHFHIGGGGCLINDAETAYHIADSMLSARHKETKP